MLARLKMIFTGLAVCAALGLAWLFITNPEVSIDITEVQARETAAQSLPKVIEKSGVTITVTGADVDFRADNKISVQAIFDLAGYGLTGAGRADVTSGLRYANGDFFLDDLSLDDIEITPGDGTEAKVNDATSVAAGLWNRAKEAVSQGDEDVSSAMARMADRFVPRAKTAAREAVDEALRTTPVYSLKGKDMKHSLAALALKDVTFSEDAVHVVLDPRTAVLKLIGFAVLGLFACLAGLGWALSLSRL